ncbi:MAG: hypothetical protein ACR2HX_14965 [Pyrinomonadaceae bacterium]
MGHKNHRMRVYAAVVVVLLPLIGLGLPPAQVRQGPTGAVVKQVDDVLIGVQDAEGQLATQAVSERREAEMIVRQVDHVLLATPNNGRSLVALLTDSLALPIVWPQPGSEWKASTGIGLGNVTLEVFHREPPPQGQAPRLPRISSLALQPTDLKVALNELRSRGIDHDPPPEPRPRNAGEPLPRWTTVGLEGFGHGLFLIQYIFDMDERRLRFDRVLRERDGGPLGVVRVLEVAIAPDRVDEVKAQWTKLLGPTASGESDLWIVGDGPKIRLVRMGDSRAGNFVIEVKKLRRAAQALRRLGISARTTKRQIRIDPGQLSGLRLVLQEQQAPLPSRQ